MRERYIFPPVFFFRSKKKTIIYLSSFSSSTSVFRTPQCNQRERSHTSVLLLYLISVVSFVFIRFFGCKRRRDDFFNGSMLSLALTPPLFPFAPLFSLPLPPPPPDTMNDNERSQCPTPSLSLSLSFSLRRRRRRPHFFPFRALSLHLHHPSEKKHKIAHALASTVFCSDAAKSAYEGVPGPLSSTK